MQDNSIEVEIPKTKKRFKKQGINTYVYHVIERKNNKDKNSKDVVKLIGKVSKKGYMYPNEFYFKYYPENDVFIKPVPLKEFDTQSKIGAISAIYKIAESLGLIDCIKLIFNEDSSLIMSLVSYYIIARDSSAMLYSDFMFDHYGKCNLILSEATISRLFNQKITREKVDSFKSAFLCHMMTKFKKEKRKENRFYIDVDATNHNVSSSNCTMAEYGKAKVDEDLPQINMAFFYDRQNGVPIFYDCFYGSITDLSYCKIGFEQFLLNLNFEKNKINYDFILDRGYFSPQNMAFLVNKSLSFAIMGKSNLMFSEYIKTYESIIQSSENLISLGTYGIKIKGCAFKGENQKEYFIYLYYDSSKALIEKSGIEQKLFNAKKALDGKKIDINGGLKRTYQKYLNIEETKSGKILSFSTNTEYINNLLKEAGYFWIVSTMELTPLEMLEAYKTRDEIEKCFRIVKCENDFNKTYAQNDNALYAKLMLGFISATIRSEFVFLTREISHCNHNISVQKMILALDKIIMNQVHNHYALKYTYTALQQTIMNAINLKKDDIDSIILDWNNRIKN